MRLSAKKNETKWIEGLNGQKWTEDIRWSRLQRWTFAKGKQQQEGFWGLEWQPRNFWFDSWQVCITPIQTSRQVATVALWLLSAGRLFQLTNNELRGEKFILRVWQWLSWLRVSSVFYGPEELHVLHSLPNVTRAVKRRMSWAGHEARTGERRGAYRILIGNLRKRDHLEDVGEDWKIISKRIFEMEDRGYGLDWSGSGNKLPGCIKCGEFLE